MFTVLVIGWVCPLHTQNMVGTRRRPNEYSYSYIFYETKIIIKINNGGGYYVACRRTRTLLLCFLVRGVVFFFRNIVCANSVSLCKIPLFVQIPRFVVPLFVQIPPPSTKFYAISSRIVKIPLCRFRFLYKARLSRFLLQNTQKTHSTATKKSRHKKFVRVQLR